MANGGEILKNAMENEERNVDLSPITSTTNTINDFRIIPNPEDKKHDEDEEPVVKLTPVEYFNQLKDGISEETDDNILALFNAAKTLVDRYMITGQKAAAKIAYANLVALHKEFKLLSLGITNKWVDTAAITYYIDNVADECVVVCELSNYERPIPDELIDKVALSRDIFDEFYVVFTDYTGEKRSKVEKERRQKDPILFGNIFIDGKVSPKMYYIGDWVDEYCDLTLDKMVTQMAEKTEFIREDIVKEISAEDILKDIKSKLTAK